MIELKKTEINLMFLLSRFYDIDYDDGVIVCNSINHTTTSLQKIKTILDCSSYNGTMFVITETLTEDNSITVRSSFIESLQFESLVIYSDEIVVRFKDGICE